MVRAAAWVEGLFYYERTETIVAKNRTPKKRGRPKKKKAATVKKATASTGRKKRAKKAAKQAAAPPPVEAGTYKCQHPEHGPGVADVYDNGEVQVRADGRVGEYQSQAHAFDDGLQIGGRVAATPCPRPTDATPTLPVIDAPPMGRCGTTETWMMAESRKPRRIAIVGSAGSRMEAPYQDSRWEIWVINDEWRWAPRWDKLFELHDPEKFKGPSKPERHQWLRDYRGPNQLVMQKVHDDIPQSVAYPLEYIRKKYRIDETRDLYCNNTISYLLFYALDQLQAGDEIGLWGVDMATWLQDQEYGHQRPSCEYCVGLAAGMGIKVTLARNSDLLTNRVLYGFGIETGDQEQLDEKRRLGLISKQAELDNLLRDAEAKFHQYRFSNRVEHAAFGGALEQLVYSRQGDQK